MNRQILIVILLMSVVFIAGCGGDKISMNEFCRLKGFEKATYAPGINFDFNFYCYNQGQIYTHKDLKLETSHQENDQDEGQCEKTKDIIIKQDDDKGAYSKCVMIVATSEYLRNYPPENVTLQEEIYGELVVYFTENCCATDFNESELCKK